MMKSRMFSSLCERYQPQPQEILCDFTQNRLFLCYFLLLIAQDGCCATSYQGSFVGFQLDRNHLHYRIVEGESFMMPCFNKTVKIMWSRTEEEENKEAPTDCRKMYVAEVKHSGEYTFLTRGSRFVLSLQVVEKITLACFLQNESSVMLRNLAAGTVQCPGLSCSNNAAVTWFKGSRVINPQRMIFPEKGGQLRMEFFLEDSGVYFCDRQIVEQGVNWTFRRAVNVTVIPSSTALPDIRQPVNKVEQVVLGQPYNLTCKVYFSYEIDFSPKVQWFINYGGNTRNTTLLPMEKPQQKEVKLSQNILFEVIQTAILKEVTLEHLNHTYTCIATNTFGNSTSTIKFEKKGQVRWPSLVGYPFVSLLVVAGLGITLHVKRLELTIFCRSHLQFGIQNKEEDTFDAFLSYVWGSSIDSPSKEARSWTLSTETDNLNIEGNAAQRPLGILLPEVLEDQWGYRVCLLERDVLPGGAYTDDVVLAIKKSRMLICVLSEDYLASTNAVFVLESGIQALLQKSALKLLLIWTSGYKPRLINPDLVLPKMVRVALRVLPSLNWSPDDSPTTSTFWRSLKKEMPTSKTGPLRISLTQR